MAFPKDLITYDIWNKSKAIWLISLMNLALNAVSVYLLWVIAQHLGALSHLAHLAHASAASASSGTQQIAVISGAR